MPYRSAASVRETSATVTSPSAAGREEAGQLDSSTEVYVLGAESEAEAWAGETEVTETDTPQPISRFRQDTTAAAPATRRTPTCCGSQSRQAGSGLAVAGAGGENGGSTV
ncbi:hypothetical protein Slala05_27970 [Streptomyces lavendulae subsp. lavendulae]|nr:hypothetical protein Slala05_27970 [Streptomyces lavendulae subsp. lavendulae]